MLKWSSVYREKRGGIPIAIQCHTYDTLINAAAGHNPDRYKVGMHRACQDAMKSYFAFAFGLETEQGECAMY